MSDAATFTIRRMHVDDFAEVVDLWRRARQQAMPELERRMGHTPADDVEHFRDVVMRDNRVWVAHRDGGILGFLTLAHAGAEGEPVSLNHLYVDPPVQGAGVGSGLLDLAKHSSPAGLELYTHRANHRACRFYEGRGFAVEAYGISPPPESEPDVAYSWRGLENGTASAASSTRG